MANTTPTGKQIAPEILYFIKVIGRSPQTPMPMAEFSHQDSNGVLTGQPVVLARGDISDRIRLLKGEEHGASYYSKQLTEYVKGEGAILKAYPLSAPTRSGVRTTKPPRKPGPK